MHSHGGGVSLAEIFSLALLAGIACYLFAALRSGTGGRWPVHRIVVWIAGCFVTAWSVQLATANHDDFILHALAHVGLGMLAPLLLVLAAPVTLAVRSLSTVPARRLAVTLRSRPVRFLAHPGTAAVLHLGGLWLLYVGGLYTSLHNNGLLFAAVHLYVFVAGCLFAASIAGVDPNPHRAHFATRATVLVAVMAGHSILSTYLSGNPPPGVTATAAETGGLIVYYGGGAVSLVLVILLCTSWYRERGRQRRAFERRASSPV